MAQKMFFLSVLTNNILNMGFLYYCLFAIVMITPSVIFLVWYPLRNKYTNFGRGQKSQSTLNIPSLKISFAKASHTLYFQQKFCNTFPWITAVNHLKDFFFLSVTILDFSSHVCKIVVIWPGQDARSVPKVLYHSAWEEKIVWKACGLRQGQGETIYQLSS